MTEQLAQFYFTAEEIKALEMAVGTSMSNVEFTLDVAQSEEVQANGQRLLAVYNSLRTALAEGRYSLER